MKKIISGILRKGLLGEETENNPKEIKLDKDGNEITPLTDGAPQSDNILVQGIYNGVTAIGNFWLDAAEKTAVKNNFYSEVEISLKNELGRKVEIKSKGKGKGTITLEFYSDEELADFAKKLVGE